MQQEKHLKQPEGFVEFGIKRGYIIFTSRLLRYNLIKAHNYKITTKGDRYVNRLMWVNTWE